MDGAAMTTSLLRKPVLALTDEGYVWVDVPVEVVTDTRGKIISERFLPAAQAVQPAAAIVIEEQNK
jgi:hypothetical protein